MNDLESMYRDGDDRPVRVELVNPHRYPDPNTSQGDFSNSIDAGILIFLIALFIIGLIIGEF